MESDFKFRLRDNLIIVLPYFDSFGDINSLVTDWSCFKPVIHNYDRSLPFPLESFPHQIIFCYWVSRSSYINKIGNFPFVWDWFIWWSFNWQNLEKKVLFQQVFNFFCCLREWKFKLFNWVFPFLLLYCTLTLHANNWDKAIKETSPSMEIQVY